MQNHSFTATLLILLCMAIPVLVLLDILAFERVTELVQIKEIRTQRMSYRYSNKTFTVIATDDDRILKLRGMTPWQPGAYLLVTRTRLFRLALTVSAFGDPRTVRKPADVNVLAGFAFIATALACAFFIANRDAGYAAAAIIGHATFFFALWMYLQ